MSKACVLKRVPGGSRERLNVGITLHEADEQVCYISHADMCAHQRGELNAQAVPADDRSGIDAIQRKMSDAFAYKQWRRMLARKVGECRVHGRRWRSDT